MASPFLKKLVEDQNATRTSKQAQPSARKSKEELNEEKQQAAVKKSGGSAGSTTPPKGQQSRQAGQSGQGGESGESGASRMPRPTEPRPAESGSYAQRVGSVTETGTPYGAGVQAREKSGGAPESSRPTAKKETKQPTAPAAPWWAGMSAKEVATLHEKTKEERDEVSSQLSKAILPSSIPSSAAAAGLYQKPEENPFPSSAAVAGTWRDPVEQQAAPLRKELGEKQDKVNELATVHYHLKNQEQLAKVKGSADMEKVYRSARELEEDLDTIAKALSAPTTYNGMDSRFKSDGEAIKRKYGTDDLQALQRTLTAQKEQAVAALEKQGYDYKDMTGYEQMLGAKKRYEDTQERIAEEIRDNPMAAVAYSVLSVPASSVQGLDYAKGLLNGIGHSNADDLGSYVPANVYDMYATNFVRTVRGTVAQQIEENPTLQTEIGGQNVYSFLYQTGMSMADFLFNAFITGNFSGGLAGSGTKASMKAAERLSLSIMGAGAASNATADAIGRGLSNRQAYTLGAVAGFAEILTEKVSLETLLDRTAMEKSALGYLAKNTLAEGSEEVASDLINLVADIVVSRDKSEWVQNVNAYKEQGYNENEAFGLAVRDQAVSMGMSGLGGALSGGIMAGGNLLRSGVLNKGYVSPAPLVRAMMGQGTGEITSAGVETPVNVDAATDSGYNDPTRMEGGRTDGIQRGTQLDGTAGEGVQGRPVLLADGGALADAGTDRQGDLRRPGELRLTEDKAAYSRLLDEARTADQEHGWAVTPKTAEELAQCKTFISEDGGVGFAIAPDGDIEAVFRNKVRHPQGKAMQTALPQAIAEGGTKLDCYGKDLVTIYAGQGGFVPVARVAFNPEFANPGWTQGMDTPDIFVMMATDTDPDVVRSKQENYKLWTDAELAALPLMEYDEAMAYRDRLLTEQLSSKGGSPEIGDGALNSVGAAAEGQTATQYVDTLVADIRSRSAEQTASQPIDPLIADIRARGAGQTAEQGDKAEDLHSDRPDKSEGDIADSVRRMIKTIAGKGKTVGFAELPKETQQLFRDGLAKATPEVKEVLGKYHRNADYVIGAEKWSYYSGGFLRNTIQIGTHAVPSTLAHELFHMIDDKHGISRDLTESLMQDYESLSTMSGGDIRGYLLQQYPEAFSRTSKTGVPIMGEAYRGIADILNGLSGGKESYGFKHSVEYWAEPGALEAEAWAQFGRIQYENKSDVLEMLKKVFPNFYKAAIIALKGVM